MSKQERELGLREEAVTFKEVVWEGLWRRWHLNREVAEEGE